MAVDEEELYGTPLIEQLQAEIVERSSRPQIISVSTPNSHDDDLYRRYFEDMQAAPRSDRSVGSSAWHDIEPIVIDGSDQSHRWIIPDTSYLEQRLIHDGIELTLPEIKKPTTRKTITKDKRMGKAHASYTIGDINRLNLSFMKKDRTPEEISLMSGNLSYMVHMALSMNNQFLLDKPFLEVFSKDSFHTLTKMDMNKALHELTQADIVANAELAKSPMQTKLLDEAISSEKLADNTLDTLKASIDNFEYDFERQSSYANEKYTQFMEYTRAASKISAKIEETQDTIDSYEGGNVNTRLVNTIKAVIQEGSWQYHGSGIERKIKTYRAPDSQYSTESLEKHIFISTKNIICSHYNPAAGVNMSVDFGRILVELDDSGCINKARFVYDFMKNTSVQHPHLNYDSICWGNASTAYGDLVNISNPNFVGVLNLFTTLLETYCPDAPYKTLRYFQRLKNKRIEHAIEVGEGWAGCIDVMPECIKAELAIEAARKARLDAFMNPSTPVPEEVAIIGGIIKENTDLVYNEFRNMVSETRSHQRTLDNVQGLLTREQCIKLVGYSVPRILGGSVSENRRAVIMLSYLKHGLLVDGSEWTNMRGQVKSGDARCMFNDRALDYVRYGCGMDRARCYDFGGVMQLSQHIDLNNAPVIEQIAETDDSSEWLF